MPIPPFDEHGFLPPGIHECTLGEIRARFGTFQESDRRPQLFAKLETFLSEVKRTEVIVALIINGSFVTAVPEPNDIDLIIEMHSTHDFAADLGMAAHNVLSKTRVRRRFGFDLLLAREGSIEAQRWALFFQQVRLAPGQRKGILRVRI